MIGAAAERVDQCMSELRYVRTCLIYPPTHLLRGSSTLLALLLTCLLAYLLTCLLAYLVLGFLRTYMSSPTNLLTDGVCLPTNLSTDGLIDRPTD